MNPAAVSVVLIGMVIIDETIGERGAGINGINPPAARLRMVIGNITVEKCRIRIVFAVDPTAIVSASIPAGVVADNAAIDEGWTAVVKVCPQTVGTVN